MCVVTETSVALFAGMTALVLKAIFGANVRASEYLKNHAFAAHAT